MEVLVIQALYRCEASWVSCGSPTSRLISLKALSVFFLLAETSLGGINFCSGSSDSFYSLHMGLPISEVRNQTIFVTLNIQHSHKQINEGRRRDKFLPSCPPHTDPLLMAVPRGSTLDNPISQMRLRVMRSLAQSDMAELGFELHGHVRFYPNALITELLDQMISRVWSTRA